MYGVCHASANIYLDDAQLDLLNRLAAARGQPVAALVRETIDEWLANQGAVAITDGEWERRFAELLDRRQAMRSEIPQCDTEIDDDVLDTVRAVRRERATSRR